LLRVFAHPAFDDGGNNLHCARYVDAALRIARQIDRLAQFAPEMMAVGLPHRADAADRAFEVAGELGDQRVGLAGAAEEGHFDAAPVVLID